MKKIFKKSKKEENEDYVESKEMIESSDIQSEEVAAPTETTESMSIDGKAQDIGNTKRFRT